MTQWALYSIHQTASHQILNIMTKFTLFFGYLQNKFYGIYWIKPPAIGHNSTRLYATRHYEGKSLSFNDIKGENGTVVLFFAPLPYMSFT